MNDLLALARLRTFMLEEPGGHEESLPIGWLEVWMRLPNANLAGATPLQAMATPERLEQVRSALRNATRPIGDGGKPTSDHPDASSACAPASSGTQRSHENPTGDFSA